MSFEERCSGGAHPTTRLAAAALAAVLRPGDVMLDAGTGDGWLATRARGTARRVIAIDVDPGAAGLGLPGVEAACVDAAGFRERVDVVIANLPHHELLRCLPALDAAAARALIVTGGRLAQARPVRRALAGFGRVAATAADGWYCFTAVRAAS